MNIKSILLTAALLIAFAVTSQAQYVTMRVIETNFKKESGIQIVYENGETESIEIDGFQGILSPKLFSSSMENLKIINENLNKIRKKGYKLVGTSNGAGGIGSGAAINIITYTFEKAHNK